MATVPIRPRTVKPARPQTALRLFIDGHTYEVEVLKPDPELASVARRLRKPDGEDYDVAQTPHGAECSCPDYIFNRADKDPAGLGRCKHIVALQDWGLLRAPDRPRPPVIPLPQVPRPRPAAEELEEVVAGAPLTAPPTHEEICQMADLLMAEEAVPSGPCHVCKGKRVDAFGGDCVGCGGVGVVPAA